MLDTVCMLKRFIADEEIRTGQKLSYDTLASRVGSGSERTLRRWANNEVQSYDRHILAALCAYFECGPGDMLRLTSNEQDHHAQ